MDVVVGRWTWAVAATRNYCGSMGCTGADVRDSYERAALGDTANIRSSYVMRVWVFFQLLQVVTASRVRGQVPRLAAGARLLSVPTSPASYRNARYPPPPNHGDA